LTFSDCSRLKKESSQNATECGSGKSSAVSTWDYGTPRDSIIQSNFSDEYSIHVVASVTGTDILPLPEYMWMIVYQHVRKTSSLQGLDIRT
jgi:hypothetical protein